MTDIRDLLIPLTSRANPGPVEGLEAKVRVRRRRRRVGTGAAAACVLAAATFTAVSLGGQTPRYVSVAGPPASKTSVALPADQLVETVTVNGGGLLLSGQSARTPVNSCSAFGVNPATLAFGPVTQGSCDNPVLSGHKVGVVVTQGTAGQFASSVRVALAQSPSGKTSVGGKAITGATLFNYADSSESRPVWTYGGSWLWVYDVDTTSGPEAVQVSASTGEVQAVIAMPKLYRPILAANDDGLWVGESLDGAGGSVAALYAVSPGTTRPTAVIPGSAVVHWLVGAGHHIWVGTSPAGSAAQTIWRFDGPTHTQVFRVPEVGFEPTTVVGDQSNGLWTMQWQPPVSSGGAEGSRAQQIVGISPDTGAETVVATVAAVPVPVGAGAYGLVAGQAAVLSHELYILEPPFRAKGYQGYSTLVRVPVSMNAPAQTPSPSTTIAGTTSGTPSGGLPTCQAGQLRVQLKGIQGAAGNWAGAYWIASEAPGACSLSSPLQVALTDSTGKVRLTTATPFAVLALSPNTAIPAGDTATSGELAYVTLMWPTDGSFPNGQCPTSDFTPDSVTFTFGESGPVDVPNTPVDNRRLSICEGHISIGGVGRLGPG